MVTPGYIQYFDNELRRGIDLGIESWRQRVNTEAADITVRDMVYF